MQTRAAWFRACPSTRLPVPCLVAASGAACAEGTCEGTVCLLFSAAGSLVLIISHSLWVFVSTVGL